MPGECRNWPTESFIQFFLGCIIRGLSPCPRVPNSIAGLPLFNATISIRRRHKLEHKQGNEPRVPDLKPSALFVSPRIIRYDIWISAMRPLVRLEFIFHNFSNGSFICVAYRKDTYMSRSPFSALQNEAAPWNYL